LTAFIFSDLNYKMVIFLSQTESTTKYFFRKKNPAYNREENGILSRGRVTNYKELSIRVSCSLCRILRNVVCCENNLWT